MIDQHTYLLTLGLLIVLAQLLAFQFRGYSFWKYTDYLWYLLAAGSLILFVFDANQAAHSTQLIQLEGQLESFFDTGIASYTAEYRRSIDSLGPMLYEFEHLLDHRNSAAFPTGEYITLNGTKYKNVFEYLGTLANPGFVTDMPSAFPEAFFFEQAEVERMHQLVNKLLASEIPTNLVTPEWLRIAAYGLAIGVALRLAKTTAQL